MAVNLDRSQKNSETYDEHFTISNIPYGIISTSNNPKPRIATRLYGQVFVLSELVQQGHLTSLSKATEDALEQSTLNIFAALSRSEQLDVRQKLQGILKQSLDEGSQGELRSCSLHVSEVRTHVPVDVGDFSDFSCSRDHVLNAGEAIQGVRRLPAAFLHYPIGYGGRSSSIVASGTDIQRPLGQYRSPNGVVFGPSQLIDFELEVACIVGKPSKYGQPVDINDADEHIFGLVLLNDWSARDIQGLEMDPLGPFNGKSFGTSVSPWVVTLDALRPFEVAGLTREMPNAPYLDDKKQKNSYSLNLQADLVTGKTSTTVCKSTLQWLYWTFRDMIAHQTVNGCCLRTGDMLATGTVSGSTEDSHGCLLESTKGGKQSIQLADQQGSRKFLEDGDAVRLSGWAGDIGGPECVGFGDCFGTLVKQSRLV